MKTVQYLTDEYLEQCRKMTPLQIVKFLDDFRQLQAIEKESRLISIRIPKALLNSFKAKSQLQGKRYQSVIKELMAEWLKGN